MTRSSRRRWRRLCMRRARTPARSATGKSSSCRWRTVCASAPASAAARRSAHDCGCPSGKRHAKKYAVEIHPPPYHPCRSNCMTPKEVLTLIREKDVKAIDLRFVDFPGTWQHFTIPPNHLEESTFQEGLGFDGSSIRGWQAINESDMLVIPQADTAFIDPFFKETTVVLICSIQDPLTGESYSRDPRFIARKAVNYMKASGIA